jgi:uncharacterized membrane protein YfcA
MPGGAIMGWSWPMLAGCWAVILLSGMLRGFSGFGFALAASPLLAVLMPPRDAVPVVLLLQLGSSFMGARQSLMHWDRDASLWIAGAAVTTTPLGVLLLHLISPNAARVGMALVTLSAVFLLASDRLTLNLSGRWRILPFGLAAGILGGASAMPGPPVIAYFMARKVTPSVGRASMNLIFMATSIFALAINAASGSIEHGALALAALCTPAMIVGTAAGSWGFQFCNAALYRRVGLGALTVIALVALARVA